MTLRQAVARLRSLGHADASGSVRDLHQRFRPVAPGSIRSWLDRVAAPSRLQFRLRYFAEHESTDSGLQGGSDEVYVSAIGTDSAGVHFGPDGKPAAEEIRAQPVGDVSDDSVRNAWRNDPYVLLDFDLSRPGDWPRTYTATLLLVESDNESTGRSFDELYDKVGEVIRGAVVSAAIGATTAIGAAIGSVVPGVGTAVGAAVGALAGAASAAYGEIVAAVRSGLGNEIFTPRSMVLAVPDPALIRQQPEVGRERTERIEESGAVYDLVYDWHVVD